MEAKKSDFQFKDPSLESLNFIKNEKFNMEKENVDMPISLRTTVERTMENMAMVGVEIIIGNEESPFLLSALMTATFRWSSTEDDVVDALLHVNAPSLLVSYLRPVIANVTGASGYPSFNLPYLDMTENEAEDNS